MQRAIRISINQQREKSSDHQWNARPSLVRSVWCGDGYLGVWWINFVHTHGGRKTTLLRTQLAQESLRSCAGEICSLPWIMTATKRLCHEILAEILDVTIPVIASCGAGKCGMAHFKDVFYLRESWCKLFAASIFHFKEIPIPAFKRLFDGRGNLV